MDTCIYIHACARRPRDYEVYIGLILRYLFSATVKL